MKPRIHEFKKRIRAIKVVISALVAKEKDATNSRIKKTHEFTDLKNNWNN